MKHLAGLGIIVLGFFIMFWGYQAMVLPDLKNINPASAYYFEHGADMRLPAIYGTYQ